MIVVCEVVVENGFKDWPQFDFADDPSEWDGAERLVAEELRFLREFISKGRQRPRCVSPFLFVCNGVLCRSPVGQAAELTLAQLVPRVSRQVLGSGRSGPRATLRDLKLELMSKPEKDAWLERARVHAILGGMRSSMPGFRSALRCYMAFVGAYGLFVSVT